VNNGLGCGTFASLAINPGGDIFAGTTGCGDGVYRSTDNGDNWTLANTGLTSTDVVALAINSANGHIFAGTYSQMGEGGGMFRSTDNGDTWTEQNNGFTAYDVNAVVINSAGYIFAGAAGGVFRSTNGGESWLDISGGVIPPGGNVWALAIDSENYAFAGTAGGGVLRSARSTTARHIPKPRPRPTPPPRP
jgi:photosystem II stability/assembly factor-like uncharacterized protein